MVLAENPMLRPELTVMQGMLDLRGIKSLTVTAREFRILQGFCDEKKKTFKLFQVSGFFGKILTKNLD